MYAKCVCAVFNGQRVHHREASWQVRQAGTCHHFPPLDGATIIALQRWVARECHFEGVCLTICVCASVCTHTRVHFMYSKDSQFLIAVYVIKGIVNKKGGDLEVTSDDVNQNLTPLLQNYWKQTTEEGIGKCKVLTLWECCLMVGHDKCIKSWVHFKPLKETSGTLTTTSWERERIQYTYASTPLQQRKTTNIITLTCMTCVPLTLREELYSWWWGNTNFGK